MQQARIHLRQKSNRYFRRTSTYANRHVWLSIITCRH